MRNFVEPFYGSGAVLLGRPDPAGTETVNDKDGFVCNFWRAISHDPEEVAHWADWPQNESDMHARHAWLRPRRAELVSRLEGDPDYYDAKIAGWWVWGLCLWIGGGWCNENITGPWVVEDGMLVNRKGADGAWRSMIHLSSKGNGYLGGTKRQLINIGNNGKGINTLVDNGQTRKLMNIDRGGRGVHKKGIERSRPAISYPQGVHRKRLNLASSGKGLGNADLIDWFVALSDRLCNVRICCGDWKRILGPSPTTHLGTTAVFLDPPYGTDAKRDDRLYAEDCLDVAGQVCKWAIENGDNPKLRIALCGYEGEHDMPDNWTTYQWNGGNSYGNHKTGNNRRERIYFSPHCLNPENQLNLFSK